MNKRKKKIDNPEAGPHNRGSALFSPEIRRTMRVKRKLVCGVGINDADYPIMDGSIPCPFYSRWASMLRRCYAIKTLEKQPTYLGCSVEEKWLKFSNFRLWMKEQNWEGKQLDKDILFPGNRVYCEEKCVFVSGRVNSFITDRGADRGDWPIGVYYKEGVGRYVAQISNGPKKIKYLGYFDTPEEAFQAWLTEKRIQARILADEQADPRVAAALIARYENYQEEYYV